MKLIIMKLIIKMKKINMNNNNKKILNVQKVILIKIKIN